MRVGRIPVAVGLIAYGVALAADNTGLAAGATRVALKLWPLLLIAFGAEYLVRSALAERKGEGQAAGLRFDWGGAFLLLLIVALTAGVTTVQGFLQTGVFPFEDHSLSRTETAAFPAAGVSEVQVATHTGRIEVQRALREGEVTVEARYWMRGPAVQREHISRTLQEFRLNVTGKEVLRISADGPSPLNSGISYVVHVPAGIKVRAESGTGSVRVLDHSGETFLTTRTGRIEAENVRGPMRLESGTGSITVREFEQGSLEAETSTGSISVSTTRPLAGNVWLKTGTGSISLTVPQASSFKLSAETNSGSVSVPAPFTRTQTGPAYSASGTLGDGQYKVDLQTRLGSIAVNLR